MFFRKSATMPTRAQALPGRREAITTAGRHFVTGHPLHGPYPAGLEQAMFGMGCFWGAERKFWQAGPGIHVTAAGYSGGLTPNPTYAEVCSGLTGHNEVVLVVHDPQLLSYADLLRIFFDNHDPTQGMRQGNDVGTQYRSGIYTFSASQQDAAVTLRGAFAERLKARGFSPVTTEIVAAGPFYFAEEDHQQYLAKNPTGYCGLGGTGVACPVAV